MTFDESVEIDAEPAALFRLSQDYGRRLEWDPFLRSACLVGDAREAGVGVRALCVSHERVGDGNRIRLLQPAADDRRPDDKRSVVPRHLRGLLAVRGDRAGRTRVGFRYSLRARPGGLSWLLTPILRGSSRGTRAIGCGP